MRLWFEISDNKQKLEKIFLCNVNAKPCIREVVLRVGQLLAADL